MEDIKFAMGSKDKAIEFIKNITNKKITLISHTDLDGIVSAKIMSKLTNPAEIIFVSYKELNKELLAKLKKNSPEGIILTDLYINDKSFIEELERFSKVLIIDHHPSSIDLNSKKTTFLNAQGYCASYLCYSLFKNKELEKIDWLVACASIADWLYQNNEQWMRDIFKKYGEKWHGTTQEEIKKSKLWDIQYRISLAIIYFKDNLVQILNTIGERPFDMENLEAYSHIVEKEIKRVLDNFEENKEIIKGGYLIEISSKFDIGSIIANSISTKYWNNLIVILQKKNGLYYISARRQDKKMKVNELLKEITKNIPGSNVGGHEAASGGFFPARYIKEFKSRL